METVSIRIRKDTYAKLQALARADLRPVTGQLEIILADYLTRHADIADEMRKAFARVREAEA